MSSVENKQFTQQILSKLHKCPLRISRSRDLDYGFPTQYLQYKRKGSPSSMKKEFEKYKICPKENPEYSTKQYKKYFFFSYILLVSGQTIDVLY